MNGVKVLSGDTFRWSGRYTKDFGDVETLWTKMNVIEEFAIEIDSRIKDIIPSSKGLL